MSETDIGLCWYTEALALNPADVAEEEMENLRSLGLAGTAILDATQVVAYFNFINRMVLALGVELTEEETKGYNY